MKRARAIYHYVRIKNFEVQVQDCACEWVEVGDLETIFIIRKPGSPRPLTLCRERTGELARWANTRAEFSPQRQRMVEDVLGEGRKRFCPPPSPPQSPEPGELRADRATEAKLHGSYTQ